MHNHALLRRLDAILLVVLVLARVRIDTLAEAAVLPLRQNDVVRHPWLGDLLSSQAMVLLAQQQLVDPIGLLLVVSTLSGLLAYLLVAEFVRNERTRFRARMGLILVIVLVAVLAPSAKLALLRAQSGPASYSHDGGVIQTEATIDYLLQGRNPYVEDYTGTPMAEWGNDQFRSALYHYPYLPWTFIFSAPFKALAEVLFGWYDQRFVYWLLLIVTLALVPGLCRNRETKLMAVMLVGLNPIMGSDLIYGQNDSFVLAWVVLSLWLWRTGQHRGRGAGWQLASAATFGLACSSKPTAWFLAPFLLVLAAGGEPSDLWRRPLAWAGRAFRVAWPAMAVALLVIGPYIVWNPGALFDDVWRWSAGTSETPYQIWGWGASNLALVLGWVKSRFDYWPFWLPELLIGVPLLAALLKRQAGDNTPARALWNYGLFLFAFFFVSRFLNENYLGYILTFLGLGVTADLPSADGISPARAD